MSKKLTYSYVKEYIESFGYELLSKEYVNSKSKLKIQCPKNRIYEVRFDNFKNGNQRCPECFGTTIHKYNHVKKYIESFGYKLLSEEYINNKEMELQKIKYFIN